MCLLKSMLDAHALGNLNAQAEQIRAAVEEYAEYNVFQLDYPREGEPTVHIGADDLEVR